MPLDQYINYIQQEYSQGHYNEIISGVSQKLNLTFAKENMAGNVCFTNSPELRDEYKSTFAPIEVLDYIYAVLHSSTYRQKNIAFLKFDIPCVPIPKDSTTFWKLVNLGGQIRRIHLLEDPVVEDLITHYPVEGDDLVVKIKYQDGHVYINDFQYFAHVPEVVWNFYISDAQPAQQWLTDRKDRKFSVEDILNYQRIIVAILETDRLMKEIDKIQMV